ncbi:MAG: C-terminal binding protein [Thermovirgaceae bacterium]
MARFKTGIYSVVNYDGVEMEKEILDAADSEVLHLKTVEEFEENLPEIDGLICDITPITPERLSRMKKCRIVVRHGMGVENINIPAATENGIIVCNVPRFNLEEVSDHALACALSLVKKLPHYTWRVRKDRSWKLQDFPPADQFAELTLGIIGFGQIGQILARKSKGIFKNIIVYDPYIDREKCETTGVEAFEDMDDVFRAADIVSIHVPLNDETRYFVDMKRLKMMKPTAYIINTSRGGLVDLGDLQRALHEGIIAGAALDVMEGEPIPDMTHPIFDEPGLLVTPHTAWYSNTSLKKLRTIAAEEVRDVYSGKRPVGQLNEIR